MFFSLNCRRSCLLLLSSSRANRGSRLACLNVKCLSTTRVNRGAYETEYAKSINEPEKYWKERQSLVKWYRQPTTILDSSKSPFDKWYPNGEINASYNCLDVHVENGFGDQVAVIHDSPMTNVIEKWTYKRLLDEVSRLAGVLSKHGVKKGDRVLIYMPMIPQAIAVMLASSRIGAIHSLVFGGFASKELSVRINHAKPKVIVSANFGVEPGRLVNYKELLDKAVEMSEHKPHKCILYNRTMFPEADVSNNRALYLNYAKEIESSRPHECVPVDSNFPLYILYTSGTTGTPKGVERMTAPYLIALKNSMKEVYGLSEGDTWWAMSDLGWTVGHSYACYGPLVSRITSVLYEGKPVGTPDAGAVFRVLSQHNCVSMFIAPTAIRAIKQVDHYGTLAKKYSLEKLKYLFVAGEHCDAETMHWIKDIIKKPVFDHWWQTETGWPITSMCAGLMSQKELNNVPVGVSGKAVPGYDVRILDESLKEMDSKDLGRIVIKLPLPPGTMTTLWENDQLFVDLYFKSFPGYYDTADVGHKCENGFLTVLSRADDVINVAGHRISSSAIEEAILDHQELAECAVVELNDKLKGTVPYGFLIKNKDSTSSEKDLIDQVVAHVRSSIGPVACFKQAVVVNKLPKTRSGKISRGMLKSMINNKPFKMPVTLEDPNVYSDLKETLLKNGFKSVGEAL